MRRDISQAINSYTSDERLGFAEPAAGVELYLCPPTPRIAELLKKHLPKEGRESDNSVGNELMGVVVWRRAHLSISPNASSYHKHTSKKQPFSSSNRLQDSSNVNANVNVNIPAHRALAHVSKNTLHPKPEPEDDDDIPPGFGPARDEDDLPEFNFSGDFNSSAARLSSREMHSYDVRMTSTPVDRVRELIKKYGQSGASAVTTSRAESRDLSVKSWGDDDDNDIPEWRPDGPTRLPTHPMGSNLVYQQPLGGLAQPARWPRPHQHMHDARRRQQ